MGKNNPSKKNKNTINGDTDDADEQEVISVSSPASDSVTSEEEEEVDGAAVEDVSDNEDDENENENDGQNDDDDEEEVLVVEDTDEDEEEDKMEEDTTVAVAEAEKSKKKSKKNMKGNNSNGTVDELNRFPMHRVSRIIKSEDPSIRITQEAVFLINKAAEKFLHLFSMEAYACAFLDRKKHVAYNHLSSVVTKRRRLDFLTDFVPEKLKAEDALKEIPSVDPT